jgi:hypothetical protein
VAAAAVAAAAAAAGGNANAANTNLLANLPSLLQVRTHQSCHSRSLSLWL